MNKIKYELDSTKTTDEKIDGFIESTKNLLKHYRLKKCKSLFISSLFLFFIFIIDVN